MNPGCSRGLFSTEALYETSKKSTEGDCYCEKSECASNRSRPFLCLKEVGGGRENRTETRRAQPAAAISGIHILHPCEDPSPQNPDFSQTRLDSVRVISKIFQNKDSKIQIQKGYCLRLLKGHSSRLRMLQNKPKSMRKRNTKRCQ